MNQLDFDFAVSVMTEYDEDGHLTIQHDAPGLDGKAGAAPAEAVLPGGLLHRPLDPEKDSRGQPTSGAGLLSWMHGDKRHSMPLADDARTISKLPQIRKGATALYGGAGEYRTFFLIDGLDPAGLVQPGSIVANAPYSSGGEKKAHFFSMLVRESGQEAVILTHGEGQGFTATTTGGRAATMKNADGSANVTVSDNGVAIMGKTKVLGAMTVGDPSAARAVVLAEPLIAYLTALEARIATAVGASPPVMPIAAVAQTMTTRLLKGM